MLADLRLYEQGLLQSVTGETLRPGGLALTQHGVALCCLEQRARVLDVACGSGASLAWLAEQGFFAYGIDLSGVMLHAAQSCFAGPLLQASGGILPLKAGCMDLILCECSLSLFPQPAQALSEFFRLLRPGGRLLLTDLYARGRKTGDGLAPGVMTRAGLEALVSACGFSGLIWEDHTHELKTLAGQLIFTFGSLEQFFQQAACRSGQDACWSKIVKPGYFLLVAGKPAGDEEKK